MSNFSEQLYQIKTLISSPSNSDKSLGYTTLQYLQEQATSDNSLIQSLVDCNQTFLSSIINVIHVYHADEEITSLALKCLGFIMYHPSLVAAMPKEYVDRVLKSLAMLITTTQIKVVCNLGVWCISIQQLDASYLANNFDNLLRAIVHSLDNPVGSLSTTFEAIQAVTKLATQISEKMRNTSSIWAPPVYRRLLSSDKREKDMCLRCLLKIKSLIVPPELSLSKAIVKDVKQSLLPGMEEMLKHGKKIQALHAWGWFIRILGHYSLKSRHLVNELLKFPEQTFSDPDPQVQIATQVAWEGLIEALVCLPSNSCEDSLLANGPFSKSLKLIMTPIVGIMTSKTGLAVQSSCLNTWCYLLHRLDRQVNDLHILDLVVEPMFKVIFNIELEDKNIWMWKFCMDLLHDFIQAKLLSCGYDTQESSKLSPRKRDKVICQSGVPEQKNYTVKWLPWNHSQIDFLGRTIQWIFCKASTATLCPVNKDVVFNATLRLFGSFLKGVQIEIAKLSTSYDDVVQSMKAILRFVKTVTDAASSVGDANNDFQLICLRSLEAISQELDPSFLGSPLYKVPLDLKYISTGDIGHLLLMEISPINLMDLVSPIIYVTMHHLYLVLHLTYKEVGTGSVLQEAYTFYSGMLCSNDILEVLHAILVLLHSHMDRNSLKVWNIIALCLKGRIDGAKDLVSFRVQPKSTESLTLCYFLIYPLVICSFQKPVITQTECNPITVSSPTFSEDPSLEQITLVWMSLYCLLISSNLQEVQGKNIFVEDLCSALDYILFQKSDLSEVITGINLSDNTQTYHLLSLFGNVAKCIIQNLHIEKVTPDAIKSGYMKSSGFNNCLEFIVRLMDFVNTNKGAAEYILSRLLPPLTSLVCRLQWKDDIISVYKVLCDPLLPLLSETGSLSESVKNQLPILWAEIIKSLQRSWPTIKFDSSFLKLQASLLEKALDHQNSSISDPTITFWNSCYGDQAHLDFPPSLFHVLDKLSRYGKMKIKNRFTPALQKDASRSEAITCFPTHEVKASLNTCSKRVKILGNVDNGSLCKSSLPPSFPKRKRSELTEHQKEVRRAQQGKLRDCSGHGPGVRTYTSADFSQGNHEDSQDSQDIRDSELILDLLRRAG